MKIFSELTIDIKVKKHKGETKPGGLYMYGNE